MNIAYSEEMRPPKELFSREWFESWDAADPWEYRTHRIDETKKKLEDLEVKLRQKIWKRGGGYKQDLLVDTVTRLNVHIGVWKVYYLDGWDGALKGIMIWPHRNENNEVWVSEWEEAKEFGGMGKERRTGVYMVMLSSECVEWLNMVSHWVSE